MKLLHGDCLELMKDISDKSIDAIITDPPYGTTDSKWDNVIPFEPMWEQLHRIIKDNGSIVLFGSEPFSSSLRMSNIKNYRYDWIWDKNNPSGFLNSNKMPLKRHEIISVFYKKLPTYNPQFTKRDKKDIRRIGDKNKHKKEVSKYIDSSYSSNIKREQSKLYKLDMVFPQSIILFKKGNGWAYKDKYRHPTRKPVPLIEYLIKTYTNENETVLDFTMGSGTCGVACLNTNRNFIGIEKDDKYFNLASERIKYAIDNKQYTML